MSYSRRRAICAALLWLAAGCRRTPEREVERLAILPVENLSADAGLNWIGSAVSDLVHSQTAGLATLYTYRPATASDTQANRATRVLRGYITQNGDQIEMRAFLQDAVTGKTLRIVTAASPTASAAPGLAAALLRELAPGVPIATRNPEAVRKWATALQSGRGAAVPLLREAVAADPAFAEAGMALVQTLFVTGDREGAHASAREALARPLDPISRSRMELALAAIENDAASHAQAAEKLARLLPTDAEVNVQAASQMTNQRQLAKAIEFYDKALRADPERGATWNEAAYAQAFTGQFDKALTMIAQYAATEQASSNPADSRGDIHYMAGRFEDSEKAYLEAFQKDPRNLGVISIRKAAEARRMIGDLPAADAHFQRYLDASHQAASGLPKAQWLYSTGRKQEGVQMLEQMVASEGRPEGSAFARAQLTVWRLIEGDREGSRKYRPIAGTGAARLAALCDFLASPPASASEWSERVDRAFPDAKDAALKQYALAYSLLLGGHFREAGLVLREIYQAATPLNDGQVRVLYAWALTESGKLKEAQTVLAVLPHPQTTGEATFDVLAFPRILAVRAALLENAGDKSRAAELRTLYRKYGGR